MLDTLWPPQLAARADQHSLGALESLSPVLMERAALSLANWVDELLDASGSVCILCGPGNNGGDGVALARILHVRTRPVCVYLVCGERPGSVAEQARAARAFGVEVHEGLPAKDEEAQLYVDALLGTGSSGAPRGAIADALAWLDGRGPVLAVDLPTGVDGATGTVAGASVRATHTLTFERSMPGLHQPPGKAIRGRLRVATIGLVAPADAASSMRLISPARVRSLLDGLAPAQHKGQRGHVLVVGGSPGTEGACVLAGAGALGGGAGLVTLCADGSAVVESALRERPELMQCAFDPGAWTLKGDVLVVGPGLTRTEALAEAQSLWRDDPRPAVWDASALGLELDANEHASVRVLTPHPKEAAGLLTRLDASPWTVEVVQSDRVQAARRLSELSGACVVLKGEGSVVCRGEAVAIGTTGDERLATAGSGDVLAGLIAALLARGLGPFDAACVGVHLHGLVGEAQPSVGARAMDLAGALPGVLAPESTLVGKDWPELVRG